MLKEKLTTLLERWQATTTSSAFPAGDVLLNMKGFTPKARLASLLTRIKSPRLLQSHGCKCICTLNCAVCVFVRLHLSYSGLLYVWPFTLYRQLWQWRLTLCLWTEKQPYTDWKLVKSRFFFLKKRVQAVHSNAFLYFTGVPVSLSFYCCHSSRTGLHNSAWYSASPLWHGTISPLLARYYVVAM